MGIIVWKYNKIWFQNHTCVVCPIIFSISFLSEYACSMVGHRWAENRKKCCRHQSHYEIMHAHRVNVRPIEYAKRKSFLCFLVLITTNHNKPLQWRHNGCDGVLNHHPHDCLHNRLFRHRPRKTSNLRVTGLCVGNSPVTGEFPAQKAGNAENVSIR